MIQFACDSLHERGIALLLSRNRKHKPAFNTLFRHFKKRAQYSVERHEHRYECNSLGNSWVLT